MTAADDPFKDRRRGRNGCCKSTGGAGFRGNSRAPAIAGKAGGIADNPGYDLREGRPQAAEQGGMIRIIRIGTAAIKEKITGFSIRQRQGLYEMRSHFEGIGNELFDRRTAADLFKSRF